MSILLHCRSCTQDRHTKPMRHIVAGEQVKVNDAGVLFTLMLDCGHVQQHLAHDLDESDAITANLVRIDVAVLQAEEDARKAAADHAAEIAARGFTIEG